MGGRNVENVKKLLPKLYKCKENYKHTVLRSSADYYYKKHEYNCTGTHQNKNVQSSHKKKILKMADEKETSCKKKPW